MPLHTNTYTNSNVSKADGEWEQKAKWEEKKELDNKIDEIETTAYKI